MPLVLIPTPQGPAPPVANIPGGAVLLAPVINALPSQAPSPPPEGIITEDNSPTPPGDILMITEGGTIMMTE